MVISAGPERVTIPDVTGMTLDEATAALESAGLQVEVREILGGLFGGRGRVLNQSPGAGEQTAPDSPVTIHLP
ncbi:MAG: PASTA domain-containing protein [Citricoccus sp.]